MIAIDPSRLDLAREFRARPYGPHSADLQRMLNIMRAGPYPGRYVLIQRKLGDPFELARLGAQRGDPPTVLGPIYATRPEAEWAVFKLRWEALTGHPLELPEE